MSPLLSPKASAVTWRCPTRSPTTSPSSHLTTATRLIPKAATERPRRPPAEPWTPPTACTVPTTSSYTCERLSHHCTKPTVFFRASDALPVILLLFYNYPNTVVATRGTDCSSLCSPCPTWFIIGHGQVLYLFRKSILLFIGWCLLLSAAVHWVREKKVESGTVVTRRIFPNKQTNNATKRNVAKHMYTRVVCIWMTHHSIVCMFVLLSFLLKKRRENCMICRMHVRCLRRTSIVLVALAWFAQKNFRSHFRSVWGLFTLTLSFEMQLLTQANGTGLVFQKQGLF